MQILSSTPKSKFHQHKKKCEQVIFNFSFKLVLPPQFSWTWISLDRQWVCVWVWCQSEIKSISGNQKPWESVLSLKTDTKPLAHSLMVMPKWDLDVSPELKEKEIKEIIDIYSLCSLIHPGVAISRTCHYATACQTIINYTNWALPLK